MTDKDAYMDFEVNPDLEFEFFLARELSMPVARLRKEIDTDELRCWRMYFARKAQREELERLTAG